MQLFSHHLPDVLRCSKSVFLLSAVEIYRRIDDVYQAESNTQRSGLRLFWNDTEVHAWLRGSICNIHIIVSVYPAYVPRSGLLTLRLH